ncbi:hypothetical protein ACIA8K_39645 [Catenuloplanes sp. NPDC051500]|uniref:hypothetical protein n=1 Tax=Catenuloplanes sp. NPDC051500 TaxID=3363959 RepID=UPI00378E047F
MVGLFQFRMVTDPMPDDGMVQAILDLDDESVVEFAPEENIGYVWFARTAPSLADAIVAATLELERVGLRPVRVEPRELVTVGEAAARLGRPVQEITAWWEGELSEPDLPSPCEMRSDGSGVIFLWDDIAAWVRTRLGETVPDDPQILMAATAALRLRGFRQAEPGVEPLVAGLIGPRR